MQQPQNTKENEGVNARPEEVAALDNGQASEAGAKVPGAPPPHAKRPAAEDELLAMDARLELEGDPMRKEKVAAAEDRLRLLRLGLARSRARANGPRTFDEAAGVGEPPSFIQRPTARRAAAAAAEEEEEACLRAKAEAEAVTAAAAAAVETEGATAVKVAIEKPHAAVPAWPPSERCMASLVASMMKNAAAEKAVARVGAARAEEVEVGKTGAVKAAARAMAMAMVTEAAAMAVPSNFLTAAEDGRALGELVLSAGREGATCLFDEHVEAPMRDLLANTTSRRSRLIQLRAELEVAEASALASAKADERELARLYVKSFAAEAAISRGKKSAE